jgi:hypothetical protein
MLATVKEGLQIERLPGLVYKCGDIIVAPSPKDTALAFVYMTWEKEGLLPVIFHERPVSLTEFLNVYGAPSQITLAAYREGNPIEILGLGWVLDLVRMEGQAPFLKANIGLGFLRGVNIHDTGSAGRMMLEWMFQELDVNVLTGITPMPNRAICLFTKRIGFEVIGVAKDSTLWQGEPCDSQIAYLSRKRWEEVKREGYDDGWE